MMKRLFSILLSVMILALAGCCSTKVEGNAESGAGKVTETVKQSEEEKNEIGQVEEKPTEDKEKPTEGVEETEKPTPSTDRDSEGEKLDNSEQGSVSEPASKENSTVTAGTKTEPADDKTPKEQVTPTPTPKPAEKKPEQSTQTESKPVTEEKAVSYSPDTVVALTIAKCRAGGMITTQENLANALAEGRITQEEYNEYYPYDGLEDAYYSVFVETDLNKASTISGQLLGSEDAIAGYIASTLLLENSQVFNVLYAGIYTHNGNSFYEFRCLR